MTLRRTDTFTGFTHENYKMILEWQYMNTDYIVHKEYLTYDINSFIADIGGYLGLLLGHSLLSVYEWLGSCIYKAVKAIGIGRF